MSGSDFSDPDQNIHIPARDLTGTRDAKLAELDALLGQLHMVRLVLCGQPVRLAGYPGAAGGRPSPRPQLWSRVAGRLRDVLGSFSHRTADTKSERT
jgi:hypothetical protein